MNREPEEVAIRTAFARRRPMTVPADLEVRLNRITDDTRPLRPLPIRMALGLAPWALLTAAGLVLAFGPFLLERGQSAAGAPGSGGWTAAAPGGGFADVGWFGLPWVPSLIALGVIQVLSVAWRIYRGERPTSSPKSGPRLNTIRWDLAVIIPILLAWNLVSDSDAIVYGSVQGPGPEASETRVADAVWFDEKDPTGWGLSYSAPHYIYRLRPGEAFSYILSVRNDWPLPITLLGLAPPDEETAAFIREGVDHVPSGLGFLRDPAVVSAARGNVVPFHSIVLGPGEEVPVVVAEIAGSCADPAGEVDPSTQPYVTRSRNRRVSFVYEVAAWRRVGVTYPPFGITVPTIEGCMSDS